jgi:hypothetical protein
MSRLFAALAACLAFLPPSAWSQEPEEPDEVAASITRSAEGADVYLISPAAGAIGLSPITVVFGLKGMGVAPAGVEHDGAGHHHLLVDADPPPAGEPIPEDDQHIHLDGGETQLTLELPAGEHTLQAVFADHAHRPHDPALMSPRVKVDIIEVQ